MSNISTLKSREVISILKKLGFKEIRQKGSHKQFRHKDKLLLLFMDLKTYILKYCVVFQKI